jgi:hypothetical protein
MFGIFLSKTDVTHEGWKKLMSHMSRLKENWVSARVHLNDVYGCLPSPGVNVMILEIVSSKNKRKFVDFD